MLITTPLKLLKFVGVRTTVLPQPVGIVGCKYKIILRPINHSEKIAGNQCRQFQSTTGDDISPSVINGLQQLFDPRLNKGLGFTIEERQAMGIHGLMPPQFRSQEKQLEVCLLGVEEQPTDLLKYSFLYDLKDRHEKVFFRLLSENIQKYMPIIYTPTVGLACQKFGFIFRKPCGLFITIYDKGHVYDVVKNWPEQDVRVIVVTDGERILGLGDLGANGMGISVGKLCLYTALGGIKPHQCLPVAIDVGTNNKELRRHPYYVGLRQKRVQEKEYDELIDEFMAAVVKRFGQDILIQFEDFANVNAFKFLKKYQNKYCTFNDDIQGTASVAVAGIFGTQRITKLQISDYKILFYGAGAAATGIAELLVDSMGLLGVPRSTAVKNIWMMDIDGLLVKNRSKPVSANTKQFAQDHKPMTGLLDVVKEVKPNVLIGASTVGGAFTPDVITEMGNLNERPVIFALSNPTENSECTAENAYRLTKGRAIFASGSPFDPVDVDGKLLRSGQGNNAYIFPGIGLGVIMSGMHHIPNEIFLIAAQTLANFLSEKDLEEGLLYPPLSKVKELSVLIAVNIMNHAYEKAIATTYPEPEDKIAYIRSQQYNYMYENQLPSKYKWPYDSEAITAK